MKLREVAGPEAIDAAIASLAARINDDYRGRELVVVCVLKGSFMFVSDLVRKLEMPVKVDFIRASSYGDGTVSSGTVSFRVDVELDIDGKDVLILEDILDTGRTLVAVREHLVSRRPKSVAACTFIDKPSRRAVDVKAEYTGLTVEDVFLVGYGLDLAEEYRNLHGLYEILPEEA